MAWGSFLFPKDTLCSLLENRQGWMGLDVLPIEVEPASYHPLVWPFTPSDTRAFICRTKLCTAASAAEPALRGPLSR